VYSAQWSRLDNAAKIFPPSTSKDNTKVFRFSCELTEAVEPEPLKRALDAGLVKFPFYRFIIRRGFFWYYFEKSDLQPEVREEYKPPCAPLYRLNRYNLLFEISYYRNRINLEIYHALSDGVGALQFLKAIVSHYLLETHRDIVIDEGTGGDDSSDEQRSRDAFDKYYSGVKSLKFPRLPRAYRISGERLPESRLGIIEGHVSTAVMLKKVHEYHATLGEFITALLICSIHEEMNVRDAVRPVSVSIPVDLRRYFATLTARNFFSTITVSHDFSGEARDFEAILAEVKDSFKAQLRPEKIHERLDQLSSLEHVLPIKMVPLAVKAPVLRTIAGQEGTVTFSNIGKITMPAAFTPYIRLFSIFNGGRAPRICLCSFGDVLNIGFASPFVSRGLQRAFFRALSAFGVDVEIVSNTGAYDAVLP
jgi:hypothetical protein